MILLKKKNKKLIKERIYFLKDKIYLKNIKLFLELIIKLL